MEAVLLSLVVLSPWLLGAVAPLEFLIDAGLAVLLVLWAARMLLEWRLTWPRCGLALCAAALLLLDLGQVLPLPRPVLARLSPDTGRLYGQLLPRAPEVLAEGMGRAPDPTPVGATVSLYPAATYRELSRLLCWLLVFLVVRQNIATAASLRRLSAVAVANGALLALFGVVQFFSAPPRTVYWVCRAPTQTFGPFICHNHFAFYLNLCVGLGLGLLLGGRAAGQGDGHRRRGAGTESPRPLLQDPSSMWVVGALALMVSSVALSLSRGGFLALVGGLAVFLVVESALSPRFWRLGSLLLVLSGAAGLAAWFGLPLIRARLSTIGPAAAWDSRVSFWAHTLPLVRHFPWWGTGHGTFQYVEPLYRRTTAEAGVVFAHAHNEYLEALVEGGLARLALTLTAAALVLWMGFRAVRRANDPRDRGLAMGALVAVSTVLLHSAVDFGLHIPAVALLATVLCAHLAVLGGPGGGTETEPRPAFRLRFAAIQPALGAGALLLLGGVVLAEGWRVCRAESFALAGQFAPVGPGEQLADLEAAAAADPASAELQVQLGQALLVRYETRKAELAQRRLAGAAAQAATLPLLAALPAGPGSSAAVPAAWTGSAAAWQELGRRQDEGLAREYLFPALGHCLTARDLCPLLPEPHETLASYGGAIAEANARVIYLDRATLVAPHKPGLWFLSGRELLAAGRPGQACEHWRRSLELSDQYFGPILAAAAPAFTPEQILEQVLPDRPDMIVAAAAELFPDPEAWEEARPFLQKAAALLDARRGTLTAKDWYLKAQIHVALGQGEEARAAYRLALGEAPRELDWRCDFAEVLQRQGRRPEALREVLAVLAEQPGHARARELADQVTREMAAH